MSAGYCSYDNEVPVFKRKTKKEGNKNIFYMSN